MHCIDLQLYIVFFCIEFYEYKFDMEEAILFGTLKYIDA